MNAIRMHIEPLWQAEIVAGDILVIRYEGCKGAPGMKELMLSIDALIGLGLDKKVGLITDARFSDSTTEQSSDMFLRKLMTAV